MFNAFVKSAFPDLDDLLMASWNVVSIFVNVGSEDLMLHNSIGDLHDVLRKFDQYFERPKKRSESSVGGKFKQDTTYRSCRGVWNFVSIVREAMRFICIDHRCTAHQLIIHSRASKQYSHRARRTPHF